MSYILTFRLSNEIAIVTGGQLVNFKVRLHINLT
jgi:hypothetical protein